MQFANGGLGQLYRDNFDNTDKGHGQREAVTQQDAEPVVQRIVAATDPPSEPPSEDCGQQQRHRECNSPVEIAAEVSTRQWAFRNKRSAIGRQLEPVFRGQQIRKRAAAEKARIVRNAEQQKEDQTGV
ncbi:hypothetical protein [Sphingobacterium thalpophilum]|uniref:hypothetical protein n=1 Tax=Sphingobacterium thalpophilum TaxID=259 RepID=UPI003C72A67D